MECTLDTVVMRVIVPVLLAALAVAAGLVAFELLVEAADLRDERDDPARFGRLEFDL